MYDVVYLERGSRSTVLAKELPSERAVDVARQEARRRGVGRMFGAGSELTQSGRLVLIVDSGKQAEAVAPGPVPARARPRRRGDFG